MKKGYLFVILAGILYGGVTFGGQLFVNAGLSLYELSAFTLMFGFLLLPFILFKKECKLKKSMIGFFLGLGLIGALLRLSQFGAIVLGVPVAIAVLLLYTQPLWTVIFSRVFLRERITKHKILAVILVLVGLIVLVNPFGTTDIGTLPGIIVGLFSGIFMAALVIYTKKARMKRYHVITTTFGYSGFGLFFLVLLYPMMLLATQDTSVIGVSFNLPGTMWFYLLIFAVVCCLLPYALLFKGVKKVPASSAGIILLIEPLSAAILVGLFLQQALTANMLVDGILILMANYLIFKKDIHLFHIDKLHS